MAAKPGFFNDNLFRAYPFLEDQDDVRERIPDRLIVDFGCTFLPGATFNAETDRVWLAWVRRVNCGAGTTTTTPVDDEDTLVGDLEFGFRTDAEGMENSLLVFQVDMLAAQYATVDGWAFEVAEADLPDGFDEPEIECEDLPKWEGFLTVGDLEDLVLSLECGEFADGLYYVEPARIEDRTGHYIRSLRIANAERTRATSPADCRPLCWPFDFQDYYFVCGCITGPVVFAEGYSLTPTIDAGQNAVAFAASPGVGLGFPCVEQPYFPDEDSPSARSTLSGALLCPDVIRQINGVAAAQFLFQHGPGVTITAKQAQHRIIVDVNMLGFAAKPDVDADEAVECEPPSEDPCDCGPLDDEDFECPDPPESGGCTGTLSITSRRTGGEQDTVLSFLARDGEDYLTDAPIRTIRFYYDDRTDSTPPLPYEDSEVDLGLGWTAEELQYALEAMTSIGAGNVSVAKGTSVYQGKSVGWFTIRFTGDFAGALVEFGIAWKDGFMTPGGDCEEYLSAAGVFDWRTDEADVGAWTADERTIAADPCERTFIDETASDHLRGYAQVGGLVNAKHRVRIYGSPADDGTFALIYDEEPTVAISCAAEPEEVQEVLEDLLGEGTVAVTGTPGDYIIEYIGALGGQAIVLPEGEIDACPAPMTSTTEEDGEPSAIYTSQAVDGVSGSVTAVWRYTGGSTACFDDPTCGYDIPLVTPLTNAENAGSTYDRNPDNLIIGGEAVDGDLSRWLSDTEINELCLESVPAYRATLSTRTGGAEPIFLVDNTHSLYQQVWITDNDDYELVIECYSADGVGQAAFLFGHLGRWRDASTFLITTVVRDVSDYIIYDSGDTVPLTVTIPISNVLAEWPAEWGSPPTGANMLLSIRTTGLRELEIYSVRLERVV